MSTTSAPARTERPRSLFGLRETPGRLALGVFRGPLQLYRRGCGWLLGRTFVLLVHVGPARELRIGRESCTPEHRFLSDDEAVAIAAEFRRRHPWRLRLMSMILGWGDLSDDDTLTRFACGHPFVALRPAQPTAQQGEARRRRKRGAPR